MEELDFIHAMADELILTWNRVYIENYSTNISASTAARSFALAFYSICKENRNIVPINFMIGLLVESLSDVVVEDTRQILDA